MAEEENQALSTVLVVDDDPDVLAIASMALEAAGYTVIEATNGLDAKRILQTNPEIGLLFTDIVMPGPLDGFELAHEAKQLRPSLPVVYTSGYIKNVPWGRAGIGYGPMIPKPWKQDQVVRTIAEMLQGRAATN